jgi:hypothetical protein
MAIAKAKLDRDASSRSVGLRELDSVRLTRAVWAKNREFSPGVVGRVVYCHGAEAYEVEFPGISDIFQIAAEDLEKL